MLLCRKAVIDFGGGGEYIYIIIIIIKTSAEFEVQTINLAYRCNISTWCIPETP
jgi:hypothetical protein